MYKVTQKYQRNARVEETTFEEEFNTTEEAKEFVEQKRKEIWFKTHSELSSGQRRGDIMEIAARYSFKIHN